MKELDVMVRMYRQSNGEVMVEFWSYKSELLVALDPSWMETLENAISDSQKLPAGAKVEFVLKA